jgi:signal peptidase I
LTQASLIASILLLCWSRIVFEPLAIQILLGVIGGIYLVSITLCLTGKRPALIKPLRQWLLVSGFIMVSISGLSAGYAYKHQWLGIHIYFVPSMSMHPTLKPGQFILLDTWAYQQQVPKQKDVVVFEHDTENLWLVKRISNWPDGHIQRNDLFYVLGDNQAASRDSRSFGGISQEQVVGKVKLVLLGIDQKHLFVAGSFLQIIQ